MNSHARLIPGEGAGEGDACMREATVVPCTIVIFGASGDLTARKLMPALQHLYATGQLPENFAVLGVARSEMDDEGFRSELRDKLADFGKLDEGSWERFAKHLFYKRLTYDEGEDYDALAERLDEVCTQMDTGPHRIFYLAIPPQLYGAVAMRLGEAGLAASQSDDAWSRIVVEKPFGHDLESARELDAQLHEHFDESQIFRIDHYLAKETVQNILLFRFANAIFEPVWNRNYIDYVSIIAAESLGVGHRAGYYEKAGVLRDMFQNHMMQLLSLAAMEPPSRFEADAVRDEKVKVYKALRPFDTAHRFDDIVLGQYTKGRVNGEDVPAYRDEKKVDPDSVTPTFAMLKVLIDNWRWQGVPFYLTSGKRLAAKSTRIIVHFKEVPHSMLRHVLGEHVTANRLVMEAAPRQAITMNFQTKEAGSRLCLTSSAMTFDFEEGRQGPPLEAYEKVLLDCISGDQTLFWRQDGVELCWGFLTPILQMCESCMELDEHVMGYPAGSWGPHQVEELHPGFGEDVE